jgi:hypothetical protein
MMTEEVLTCGTCRCWHKLPPNPVALKLIKGHCRAIPPQITPLYTLVNQMTVQGPVTILNPVLDANNVNAAYRTLPPEFPACHMHQKKEEWQEGSEEFI